MDLKDRFYTNKFSPARSFGVERCAAVHILLQTEGFQRDRLFVLLAAVGSGSSEFRYACTGTVSTVCAKTRGGSGGWAGGIRRRLDCLPMFSIVPAQTHETEHLNIRVVEI